MTHLDYRIRIFKIQSLISGGKEIRVKKYLHPEGSMIKADYRALSSTEVQQNKDVHEDATVQFIINPRKVDVSCFIEYDRPIFGTTTYQITGIDPYKDRRSGKFTLRAKQVNPEEFDEEEWSTQYDMD